MTTPQQDFKNLLNQIHEAIPDMPWLKKVGKKEEPKPVAEPSKATSIPARPSVETILGFDVLSVAKAGLTKDVNGVDMTIIEVTLDVDADDPNVPGGIELDFEGRRFVAPNSSERVRFYSKDGTVLSEVDFSP